MSPRSLAALAALALSLAPALPSPSSASCPRIIRPFGEWYAEADAVFVGRAIDVTDVPLAKTSDTPNHIDFAEYTTRFRVDERFKGDLGDEVVVLGQNTWHNCVVTFEPGETYVVFAFRGPGPSASGAGPVGTAPVGLRTNDSSPTGLAAGRSDALAYLRRRAALGKEPSLVGAVYDRTPDSIEGMYARSRIGLYGLGTHGGVTVTLSGNDHIFTTTADSDGGFAFDAIPAGRYTIHAELPEGVRLLERFEAALYSGEIEGEKADEVTINENETVARYFVVSEAAMVSGRAVFESGKSMTMVDAQLIPASEAGASQPQSLYSDIHSSEGDFRFRVVPPGEYLLVVNPRHEDAFDENGQTFYYPGVTAAAEAMRIRVGDGKSIDLGAVKAPPRSMGFVAVDLVTTDASGHGVAATVGVALTSTDQAISVMADKNGHVRVYLRPNSHFVVEATYYAEDRIETHATSEVDTHDRATATLLLVLAPVVAKPPQP